jgi:Domain of unknown function (DUF4296)
MGYRIELYILQLLLLFTACQSTEKTTLPDDKIVRMMVDFHVADAATNGLSGYPLDSLQQVYFQQVVTLHGVSLDEYEKNLRIAARNPDRMGKLLKRAEEIITLSTVGGAPADSLNQTPH